MTETSDINRNLLELEEELKKVKSANELVAQSRAAAEKTLEEAGKLNQSTKQLVENVNSLTGTIEKIDFPSRLDKMDSTISGINSGMQNIINRLETVERRFDESILQVKDDIQKFADEFDNRLQRLNDRMGKNHKILKILNFLIIVLVLIAIIGPFFFTP